MGIPGTFNLAELPPEVISAALQRVLAVRVEQVFVRGYSADADDAIGAGALTRKALGHVLRAQQTHLSAIERELENACADTAGRLDLLDARRLSMLDRSLANAGALIIAAMESLDRHRGFQGGERDVA